MVSLVKVTITFNFPYFQMLTHYPEPPTAIGHTEINCLGVEFVNVDPPSGQTCSQYLSEFISNSGGYLSNPNATDNCQYCPARTTDEFLAAQFNIKYSDRWLSFGLLFVYIGFNVSQGPFRVPIRNALMTVFLFYRLLSFTLLHTFASLRKRRLRLPKFFSQLFVP